MRLATYEDFNDGPIYTRYPLPDEVYDKRARLFRYYPEPILVVGCGFGGTVRAFSDLGIQAWGIDASQWAIGNRVCERVKLASILDIREWELGPFETLITEDLLPCMTDDEVLGVARNCRAIAPIVIHMVTEQGQADLNYHSTGYWMSLTGQLTVSLEGM